MYHSMMMTVNSIQSGRLVPIAPVEAKRESGESKFENCMNTFRAESANKIKAPPPLKKRYHEATLLHVQSSTPHTRYRSPMASLIHPVT